ncbi:MAG TPA: hypothetical protein ENJ09_08490 [Planctomycetes bacterium]|nr:hypothetical protein [Planctomycetota bacterium]
MGGIEISKRLVLINSASSILRSVLSLTVLLYIQQYLVAHVSPAEYEALALVFPLMLFVPLLTMVVGSGLSRYIIEAYAKHDTKRVREIVSTMFPLTLGAGVFVAIVGAILTYYIQPILGIEPAYTRDARIMFSILVGKAAVSTALLPFFTGIDVKQKFLFRNMFSLGTEVLRIALLFTLLFGVSTRVLWLVVATVPGTIIELIVFVWYSRRLVPELTYTPSLFNRALIRPICSFGGYTLMARISAVAREMLGPLFLGHGAGPQDVWSYRLGGYVESRFFPTVLGPLITLQPALTGMHAGGQEERLQRAYTRMSRYLLWTFLLFAIPAMILHQNIWDVWLDPKFAPKVQAGSIVMVLLFAKSFFVFPQPILAQIALARARNRPLAWRVAAIELSGVALAAYFIFGRHMGAIGLALATLIASAIGTPLLFWTFGLQLTGLTWKQWRRATILPGLIPALAATPVWAAAWYWIDPSGWLELIAAGALGSIVYVFVLLRFCLGPSEKQDLSKVIGKLRMRFRSKPA